MADEKNNPTPSEQLEARVVDLEVKLAFQDRTIEELDTVVREFTEKMEAMSHELELVRRSLSDMGETGPANEKPPHY